MNDKKSVLIIEDDLDLVEVIRITFGSINYHVRAAYKPEDGFQMAKEIQPDLIILDVMFGSRGHTIGFEYAIKFKQERELAIIPIMMISAINGQHPGLKFSPRMESHFLPIDAFLNKPIDPSDLVKRAEKLLKKGVSRWSNWPIKKRIR